MTSLQRRKRLQSRTPLRAGKPLKRGKGLRSLSVLKTVTGLKRSRPKHVAPKDTGFPQSVKLAVRIRAGNGDPDEARCEACGRWLGRRGGNVHHRINRQMGGSKYRNTVQNAGLLCGTPLTLCHGDATAMDRDMLGAGWVLDSGQDPAQEPVMLFDASGGGRIAWLAADGTYADEAPKGAAA
jgi:hypothetical protein